MPLSNFLDKLRTFNKSLNSRMREMLLKYNNDTFDGNKPYIISVKSRRILEYVNKDETSLEEKIKNWNKYNDILVDISNECYNYFSPSLMYVFNDEIHFVFYNEKDSYNGNINKTLTTIVSFVTRLFAIKLNDYVFTCYGKYIQFNTEYETLNYLVWRQNDCKRNNTNTLSKYSEKNITDDTTNIMYGNTLKKELIYIEDKTGDMINRRIISNNNVIFKCNFNENLKKYIYNEYL